MYKPFNINIDMIGANINPFFVIKTNDLNTPKLLFTLIQNNVAINLTDAVVRLAVIAPNGSSIIDDCIVTFAEGGKCEIVLKTEFFNAPGVYRGELMVYYSNEEIAVTPFFQYESQRAILNEDTVNGENFLHSIEKIFSDARTEAQELLDSIGDLDNFVTTEEALELANTAEENANIHTDLEVSNVLVVTDELRNTLLKQQAGFQKGRIVELFNTLSQWSLQGGFAQSIDPVIGKLKVTSNGTPTFTRKATNLDLSGVKVLKIRIFVENAPNLTRFIIYLSNNTGLTNLVSTVINGYQCIEGWNEFLIDTSKLVVTGTGTLNNDVVYMQVRVEANGSTEASVTFDTLLRDETQKPQLIFTFDDAWNTQYTEAFKRMQKKGIPGMIAVIPSNVGAVNSMTLTQLQEVYNYGWDLSNHTYNHINLKNADLYTIQNEIAQGEDWLINNGFQRASDVVVYPQGGFNSDVINEMQTRRAGRSIIESIEPGIPNDKYKIKIRNVLNTIPPLTVNSWIDEIINSGGALVLLWHNIVAPADASTKYTPTDFQTILDYAHSKRAEIDIVTFTEYLTRSGI